MHTFSKQLNPEIFTCKGRLSYYDALANVDMCERLTSNIRHEKADIGHRSAKREILRSNIEKRKS